MNSSVCLFVLSVNFFGPFPCIHVLRIVVGWAQAMGRVIRHAKDYGAILLCDERFSHPQQVNGVGLVFFFLGFDSI